MRPVLAALAALMLVTACNDGTTSGPAVDAPLPAPDASASDDSAPTTPDADDTEDDALPGTGDALPEASDATSLDAAEDATEDPCATRDCGEHGICTVEGDVASCLCEAGWVLDGASCVAACEFDPCTEPGRTRCEQAPNEPGGYACLCADGFVEDGIRCVPERCDGEVARTYLTVHDQTPLPEVTTPNQNGYDPLLRGDAVRVAVRFTRTPGATAHHLVVTLGSLAVTAETVTLDGVPVTPVTLDDRRLEVALPADAASGALVIQGTIGVTAPGLLAIESRARTSAGCAIPGSASGARVQLTGQINPKFNACNNLGDLRALQISTGVPDKNTEIYAQRNGAFTEISSNHKVLTQMTLCLSRPPGVTVSLAGSADATRPWTIDNHLLIEVYSSDPGQAGATRTEAWVTTSAGAVAPSSFANGDPIRMLNQASLPGDYTGSITPSYFTFPAGTVQLDRILPEGQPVWLRLTGLDTGVAGHLSNLFLTASEPGAWVPECRSVRDCPRTDAHNGNNLVLRAGCVDGRCGGPACGSQSACPLGQICLLGYCSDGCNASAPCPTGQVCASGQCVDVAAGGCRTYEDCATGHVCFFGRCEPGCFHPVRQNPSYASNHPSSFCILNPAGCPRCGTASTRCFSNYCRDCEIDGHCSPNQRCVNDRCVPRP